MKYIKKYENSTFYEKVEKTHTLVETIFFENCDDFIEIDRHYSSESQYNIYIYFSKVNQDVVDRVYRFNNLLGIPRWNLYAIGSKVSYSFNLERNNIDRILSDLEIYQKSNKYNL